jgi:hypothetical protein
MTRSAVRTISCEWEALLLGACLAMLSACSDGGGPSNDLSSDDAAGISTPDEGDPPDDSFQEVVEGEVPGACAFGGLSGTGYAAGDGGIHGSRKRWVLWRGNDASAHSVGCAQRSALSARAPVPGQIGHHHITGAIPRENDEACRRV